MLGGGADQLDGGLSLAGAAQPGLGSKSGTPRFSESGLRASISKVPSGVGSQGGTSSRGKQQAGNNRGEGLLSDAKDSNPGPKNVGTVRLEERPTSPRSLKLAVGGRLWVMGENRRGQCGAQAAKGRAKGSEMTMVSLPSQNLNFTPTNNSFPFFCYVGNVGHGLAPTLRPTTTESHPNSLFVFGSAGNSWKRRSLCTRRAHPLSASRYASVERQDSVQLQVVTAKETRPSSCSAHSHTTLLAMISR